MVKMVLLCFRLVVLENKPLEALSSMPIRSSFVQDSSNLRLVRRVE